MNTHLSDKQKALFLNSVSALDELAMEMAVMSDKTGDIAVTLAEWSTSVGNLYKYLTTPKEEFIDTHLNTGKWMRNLLSDKFTSVNAVPLDLNYAKFELRKWVVIKCESVTEKSVTFSHVGAHNPVSYKNKNFRDDASASQFKPGSIYVVFCTELRARVAAWHWAQEVELDKAIFINSQLKAFIKKAALLD